MKCTKCQFENPDGMKFCGECGARLEKNCQECGFSNPPTFKFCGECGHNMQKNEPPRDAETDYTKPRSYTPKFLADKILTSRSAIEGERKLVTVLFADVANYALMSEKLDPEDMHQIIDRCFEILMNEIHRLEGTINQFTGDGVMALFGAPIAHEDHAVRACHSALAIQKAVSSYSSDVKKRFGIDFRMRIGLNAGEVVVGAIGDDLRMDYTAVGDVTNLAARMESMAEPGSVCVTENIHRLVIGYFKFLSLGKVEVKGKQEPQAVYELVDKADSETRMEVAIAKGLTRFVGRENEMKALKSAWEEVCSGKGRVVGVVGETGVGKSRLLYEFLKSVKNEDCLYLKGHCLHYGGSMPYLPVLDLLKNFLYIEEDDRERHINTKLKEKLHRIKENASLYFPALQELLSLNVEDKKYIQVDPVQKKMKTFEALRDLFIHESEQRPLIIAVEDLHWIDKSSEEFIGYLIGWLANVRILLILLYRPEYIHQWGSKSYYFRVGVGQFSPKTSVELIRAVLNEGETSPELGELVTGRAGGNPFFVEELTQSLVENGHIEHKNNRFFLSCDPSEIQAPGTIQAIIASRIDRIEEGMKQVIQMASVIGREFTFRILRNIAGMKEEIKQHLLNLQGLEFISEKRLFPELEYIFKHALTQEVAYKSLLIQRRRKIHEQIGESIEALYSDRLEEYYELLAYHFGMGENKQKALQYLLLANQKAARLNAVEDALAHFENAMTILDQLPETPEYQKKRISLLADNSFIFLLQKRFLEYYELIKKFETLATSFDDDSILGRFYSRKGQCEWYFGHFENSISTLNKASELCEKSENFIDAGYACTANAWNHLCTAQFGKVFSLRNEVLRMCEKIFYLRGYVMAFIVSSTSYSHMGCWKEAIRDGQKALKMAENYSDNSLYSLAASWIAKVYVRMGDIDKALKTARLSVERAPTEMDKALGQGAFAWALCYKGEPQKGVETLSRIVSIYERIDLKPGLPGMYSMLADGLFFSGRYDESMETVKKALRISNQLGMKFFSGVAHRMLGELNLKHQAKTSGHYFETSIKILSEIKAENELTLAYAGYGRFYKQQGDFQKARKYLTQALNIFGRLGTLIGPEKVKNELSEI